MLSAVNLSERMLLNLFRHRAGSAVLPITEGRKSSNEPVKGVFLDWRACRLSRGTINRLSNSELGVEAGKRVCSFPLWSPVSFAPRLTSVRGQERLVSVSGRIAPPIFGRGVRRLRSPDASQFVSDEGREELISDVPSLNLAKGMGAKGQFVPTPLALFEGHTHKSLPHEATVANSILRMRKMWTPEAVFEKARVRLHKLIEAERRACGSACIAVKTVARRIGATPGWVRKITGRYGEASVHAHLMLNIIREHVRLRRAEAARKRAEKRARIFTAENCMEA